MSKRGMRTFAAVAAAITLGVAVGKAQAAEQTFFRIGAGGSGGTYFPIAAAIATGISKHPGSRPCDNDEQCGVPGLAAIAYSTNASVYNNEAVQGGDLDAGLAAADVTRAMFLGEGAFKGKAHQKLRVIANLYPEDLHLVLPRGFSIESLADLANKRVGIAPAGSGTQVAVLSMLKLWGVTRDNLDEVELNISDSAELLASGELDAFFYVAGWPVAAMAQLASTAGMALHSFTVDDINKIRQNIPAFISSKIPGGVYRGVNIDVQTPAVSALLVVSSDLSDKLVYDITKAMWNSVTRQLLDNGHMKGKQITIETALDGIGALGVPLHAGAEKYYKEMGLLD